MLWCEEMSVYCAKLSVVWHWRPNMRWIILGSQIILYSWTPLKYLKLQRPTYCTQHENSSAFLRSEIRLGTGSSKFTNTLKWWVRKQSIANINAKNKILISFWLKINEVLFKMPKKIKCSHRNENMRTFF